MTGRKHKKIWLLAGLTLLAVVVQQYAGAQIAPKVIFFDVGQGDATLIAGPDNIQIIIDGGPDDTLVKKIGNYLPPNDRTIEAVLLTHPDSDHLTGLIELARRYAINYVVQAAYVSETPMAQEWRALIKEKSITVIEATAGARLALSDGGRITVLAPKKGVVYKDVNAQSVICLYELVDTKMLFLGDATPESQEAIRNSRLLKNIDFVKISHHGSEKSYSAGLIDVVSPAEAIIQVGAKNRFGHPAPSVIRKLEEKNIRVRRTDQEGDIIIPLINSNERVNGVSMFEKIKILWYNILKSINLSKT